MSPETYHAYTKLADRSCHRRVLTVSIANMVTPDTILRRHPEDLESVHAVPRMEEGEQDSRSAPVVGKNPGRCR